jgi:hypothetical protein
MTTAGATRVEAVDDTEMAFTTPASGVWTALETAPAASPIFW